MQFNTYTMAGTRVAVWLVNNPSPEAPALTAVLSSYDVHEPTATADEVRALRAWTRRLREVFEAGTVAEKAERADALLVAADCRPRLVSHGNGLPFHFHYAPVRSGLASRVKVLTAAGLAHVIDDGGSERLRACGRAGCGVVFVDTSRNGSRRFCSTACQNRVKVAAYRSRSRG